MSAAAPAFDLNLEALDGLAPRERADAMAQLGTFRRQLKRNPMWGYIPHEGERQWKIDQGLPLNGNESRGQREFHEIGLANGAYVAGNRSGKTHGGAGDALIQTLPAKFIPPWLLPYKRWESEIEMKVRVIGVDLGNWLAKAMLPKLRKLIPPEALWKGDFDKAWTERTRKLQFDDGSWWDFLTHDMEIDAFASADLHIAWFDEEPKGEKGKQQFEETLGRLVDYDGHVRWTLTPLHGLDFVYAELTDQFGNPRDDDECKVVTGDIDHNPHLGRKGRERFLKKFAKDPLKLEARKSGRWVHFAGRIYPEFAEHTHVGDERPIPRKDEGAKPLVPIYASIDPGINEDHQVGLIFAWLDAEDVLEVFHEFKEPDLTVADVANHYWAVCAELSFQPRWTTIDPAARNRDHRTGRSLQFEYAQHRIFTMPGQNSRTAGFNQIKQRLKSERIVIQAGCPKLVKEFLEYRWKSAKGRSEDAPRAAPIKRNDDLLDALRYLSMSMPVKAEGEEEHEHLSEAQRAFREDIADLARPSAARIGGVL